MTETHVYSESERAVIARVEKDLLSGRYFDLIVASNKSVPLGRGPIRSSDWAAIMKTIATYAAASDRSAATAAQIFGRINLYLTPNEVMAQVAQVLAEVVRKGYTDVWGATGPNASRPSAYEHATDLHEALRLALLMTEVEMNAGFIGHVPGMGWVLQHLVERENIQIYPWTFPALAAKIAKS